MMDNLEKKCEHCGATYIVSDGYCSANECRRAEFSYVDVI